MNISFPPGFVWGASTSAHQVEGGNTNDWSEWERENASRLADQAKKILPGHVPDWDAIKTQATDLANYISGQASFHYLRYPEDIAIMRSLGLRAFRFSVEWSRIEPEKGKINETELAHYLDVIRSLKAQGIQPWVSLWHRTNPLWVRDQGGWQNKKTVQDYLEFVKTVVGRFKGEVAFWMPLNEPVMAVAGGYLGGVHPPSQKSFFLAHKVFWNLVAAQKGAYLVIHSLSPHCQVGICKEAIYAEGYNHAWYNRLLAGAIHYAGNWKFLDAVRDHADFIGIQYYRRGLVDITIRPPAGSATRFVREVKEREWESDMGWEVYPEGMYHIVSAISRRYKKPIYVTENGIAEASDRTRGRFIREHLTWLRKSIDEGADVRGYFYWSLLDNFEWDKGFWPRFGLVEVDYKTGGRTIRPSAWQYADIIKHNGFNA